MIICTIYSITTYINIDDKVIGSIFPLCSFFIFIYLRACVRACVHAHSVLRSQKRELDSLKLEFQAFVTCPPWVMGKNSGPLQEQEGLLVLSSAQLPPVAFLRSFGPEQPL